MKKLLCVVIGALIFVALCLAVDWREIGISSDSETLDQPLENVETDQESQPEWEEDADSERGGSYELLEEAKDKGKDKFIKLVGLSQPYSEVYASWHRLLEAMSRYLVNTTYGEPWYSMQPIQFNADMREWYEELIPILEIDEAIISNQREYASAVTDKPTDLDIASFFSTYEAESGRRDDGMCSEIKPAFEEWRLARAKYAQGLPQTQRLSFGQHTADISAYLFNEIKALVETRNDNVIYLSEHPEED